MLLILILLTYSSSRQLIREKDQLKRRWEWFERQVNCDVDAHYFDDDVEHFDERLQLTAQSAVDTVHDEDEDD